MPYKSNNSRHRDTSSHGKPGDEGQPKGVGNKHVGRELDEPNLTNQYTTDGADSVTTPEAKHPNRKVDKPDLDKPSYNGGH